MFIAQVEVLSTACCLVKNRRCIDGAILSLMLFASHNAEKKQWRLTKRLRPVNHDTLAIIRLRLN